MLLTDYVPLDEDLNLFSVFIQFVTEENLVLYTLRKFRRFNKASTGKLVLLEILVKHLWCLQFVTLNYSVTFL